QGRPVRANAETVRISVVGKVRRTLDGAPHHITKQSIGQAESALAFRAIGCIAGTRALSGKQDAMHRRQSCWHHAFAERFPNSTSRF
ncbi:hypothetical protein SB778_34820, partial [Paraburkholderia sp. SIMBA_050]